MNLLIVDDHKLFREGMRYVLEAGLSEDLIDNEVLSIYEATDGATALQCASLNPQLDLVLLDLSLPDASGLDILIKITESFPILPVVILSASQEGRDIRKCLDLGAMGFIPKDSSSSAVINAIRLVLTGNIYVPPALLLNQMDAPVNDRAASRVLTGRQLDVMQLIASGHSNKDIARALNLAETTVKMHVTHIMRALEVSNRTQAVVKAEKLGLVAIN